jgi:monofunctional biosynthetic peptidoglycan transglycosylase
MAALRPAAQKERGKAKGGSRTKASRKPGLVRRLALGFHRLWRWMIFAPFFLAVLAIVAFALVNPPITHTMWAEKRRVGHLARDWVPMEEIAPVMARSAVAAEDANFCLHWGFDMNAIRDALEDGAVRGASTISQQTVKNVYLWQGRSWVRKAIEAVLTPGVEAVWTKRRILEVYLNVAEFDTGVFGVEAAARRYFGVSAADLDATQAARLAAVLPNPRERDAANPSAWLRSRAASIADGAATIAADGRAACFQG